MRLAFMGTPEFALPTLQALVESSEHEVLCVFTQPDKPKGRSQQVQMPPVKQFALETGIPVLQPQKLKENTEILLELQRLGLDAVVVVAYGKMIPDDMLSVPRFGFINVHASLLPCFRGAAPINRAILQGCQTTGVTIMQISSAMDAGDVFLEAELPIPEDEDAVNLAGRLSLLGAEKLMEVLGLLEKGKITARPQKHEEATFAPMLTKEEGEIDWSRDPGTIHNMIRGLVPWPCAYTFLGGKMMKILRASYVSAGHSLPFGTLRKQGKGIEISCAGGFIIPEIVQLEGKKAMDSRSFSIGLHATELILGEKP